MYPPTELPRFFLSVPFRDSHSLGLRASCFVRLPLLFSGRCLHPFSAMPPVDLSHMQPPFFVCLLILVSRPSFPCFLLYPSWSGRRFNSFLPHLLRPKAHGLAFFNLAIVNRALFFVLSGPPDLTRSVLLFFFLHSLKICLFYPFVHRYSICVIILRHSSPVSFRLNTGLAPPLPFFIWPHASPPHICWCCVCRWHVNFTPTILRLLS